MTQTWEFTDLEFKVLWERYIHTRRLPGPLTYLSRTRWLDDYEREKFETWERLQDTVDGSIREVLANLARPEVAVKALGWNDQNSSDPQLWIRSRGVRAGARGYLLTQQPGETVAHSGGYTITECGPRGVAEAVVATLPVVGCGRLGSIPIMTDHADDLERFDDGTGSAVIEGADLSGVRRSDEFFNIPATRTGVIVVRQGRSKFGPRGISEKVIVWRDLPDDGRYVIELNQAPIAIGIGAAQLAAKIDVLIDDVLERMETHWELQG